MSKSQTTDYRPVEGFGLWWRARYWTARYLITLGLIVLPDCRYKRELLIELLAMRKRVAMAVATRIPQDG